MRKFLKRGSSDRGVDPSNDTPENRAVKAVKAFCDSGAPNSPNGGGDEIVHLPVLVEAAESSPPAATAAAYTIRKLIKDSSSKPYIQYNAIMLIRILADNPGPPFTRNIDAKFIANIKSCLQSSRDPSVQQILRETLYHFSATKSQDENLQPLLGMWKHQQNAYQMSGPATSPRPPQQQRAHRHAGLPSPAELSSRISEAKTSAQLLIQLSQTTPPQEVEHNELMKEFADRVLSANRNLHGYMNSTDPPPDPQTFQTLIETCEQLSVASSKHQRAVLAARQAMAGSVQQMNQPGGYNRQSLAPPQQQPHRVSNNGPQNVSPLVASTASPLTKVSPMAPQSPNNPFSDDNRVAGQYQYPPQSRANGASPMQPTPNSALPSNTFELPGTYDAPFAAPAGPPPNRLSQMAMSPAIEGPNRDEQQRYSFDKDAQDDDYDLYATGNSPIRQRHTEPEAQQDLSTTGTAPPPIKDWQTPQNAWSSIAASARHQSHGADEGSVMSGAVNAEDQQVPSRYYANVNGSGGITKEV